jgi:hypothetical protein
MKGMAVSLAFLVVGLSATPSLTAAGNAKRMGIFFDGRSSAPGLLEASVATGDVGECKNDRKQEQAK